MLKIKFIKNLEEIIIENKNYNRYCIPLCHGTRKHMLTLSKDERENFSNACNKILKYLKSLLKNQQFKGKCQ